jgi:SAM-dependent methyltransferase
MQIAINPRMIESLYEYWGTHLMMLKDRQRMTAYKRAIEATVKRGDVVLDVGTGSGILAFLAAKAGADRVYAIERKGAILSLARQLSIANGLDGVISFIEGDSRNVILPDKVDVIISELIGMFAIDEEMLDILIDARNRFLKNHGLIIPSCVDVFVVAIESPKTFDQCFLRLNDIFGLDFSIANALAAKNMFVTDLPEQDIRYLSKGTHLLRIDLDAFALPVVECHGTIQITQTGIFHGLAGYWEAGLSGDVYLSTDPMGAHHKTHWLNAFFPAREPLAVKLGDTAEFSFRLETHGNGMTWNCTVEADGRTRE